jgi:hypothetical protein
MMRTVRDGVKAVAATYAANWLVDRFAPGNRTLRRGVRIASAAGLALAGVRRLRSGGDTRGR